MREAVVFIHGIWMTGLEMSLLRRRVAACGYDCHQFHNHSLLSTPRQNATRLDQYARRIDADVIHFVGHSLGGIVLMHLFADHPEQKPGRVLLLGSPLKGSALAMMLNRNPITRMFLGRAIHQGLLGDAPRWKGNRQLGMIAGNRGIGAATILMLGQLPSPNDGTVAVRETSAEGITRHLQAPYSHFGMLLATPVAEAACKFLRTGEFN